MRNIIEYPVTIDEIVKCLRQLQEDLPSDLIGDMRPMLLDAAIDHVRCNSNFALDETGKILKIVRE